MSEHTPDESIVVKGLTVAYRSYKDRPTSFKETLIRFAKTGNLRHYSTFNALSDVSFSVPRGEVFGVIGSNGAGKSTLLKALMGVLKPVNGSIEIDGTIDSLIQLGAGFDSELNAIENIYLNGSLHRLSRSEITRRVPEIIEFAELEEFATTPIKYYSSGMNARLGFAVAADKNPDILLVDEVLAVGDERFRSKCYKVFERFIDEKKTIIMVSHSLEVVKRMSKRIGLLSKGKLVFVGDPDEAIERYRDESYETAL